MPRLLILFLTLAAGISCYSQKLPVLITAEAGWSDDHYEMDDAGGVFDTPQLGSGYFGIAVRKFVSTHWYVEGGIYTREYYQGVAFKNDFSSSGGSGRRFAQFPMRVGGKWSFFNDRISIRPAGGLIFSVTGVYDGSGVLEAVSYQNGNEIAYSDKTIYQTDAFFVAHANLSLEYRAGKKVYLGVSSSYNWGLQKIQLQKIEYTVNQGPLITATASTKGGYNSITGTISYRFGN